MKSDTKERIDTGGPAFACAGDTVSGSVGSQGMDMRDYFAAKAMQGFIAANKDIGNEHAPHVSFCAYYFADQMIAMSKKATP